MVTSLTNETVIWIFNFVFIYIFLYNRGWKWVGTLFIGLNAIIVSQFLESSIAVFCIFIGMIISIIGSLNVLYNIISNKKVS